MGDRFSTACHVLPLVIFYATASEVMLNELVRLQWLQQTTAGYRIHEPYTLAAGSGRPTSISAQTCRCAQPLQRAHFSQMSTACLCPNPVPDDSRPPPCSSALRRTPSPQFPQTQLKLRHLCHRSATAACVRSRRQAAPTVYVTCLSLYYIYKRVT